VNTHPQSDVVIVGAGHNGLVAATMLARAGLRVHVIEGRAIIGGATRTERPFRKVPRLATSTASYLLGLMPPEIEQRTGVKLEVIRRDPHYFLPMLDGRFLLFGTDHDAMRSQFLAMFSEADWRANRALAEEISQLRDDLAPSWLEEPLSAEATAARWIRPSLQHVFLDLVHGKVEDYLARFGFQSQLLMAMYAVTDGFSGLCGSFGTPGTGMNFLVHNMCRWPGSDGTWMVARGGMGAIARAFANAAQAHGATIETGTPVERISLQSGLVDGVVLADGRHIRTRCVISGADPFCLRALVGRAAIPDALNTRIDGFERPGTTMKINMALRGLPVFRCLPEERGQHRGTMHLLPQGSDPIAEIRAGFDQAIRGELPEFPTIEWYIHTQVDPSLRDPEGHHNAAFFIQWVPNRLRNGSWADHEESYVRHLISVAERFCPGLSAQVVDTAVLTPPKIEQEIGITHGHIHHVDNTFGFDQRMPYSAGVQGLYACSAGCHPAGSVIGAAGHNCAVRVLKDLGVQ